MIRSVWFVILFSIFLGVTLSIFEPPPEPSSDLGRSTYDNIESSPAEALLLPDRNCNQSLSKSGNIQEEKVNSSQNALTQKKTNEAPNTNADQDISAELHATTSTPVPDGTTATSSSLLTDVGNTATTTEFTSGEIATTTADNSTTTPVISLGGAGGGGGGGGGATPAPTPNQPPALALIGESSVSIPVGSSYTESGATASDPEDGDLSSVVVISGDTVNSYLAGTYTLSYTVSDSAGLSAATTTRTVTVNPPASVPESAQEPTYTLAPLGEVASLSISSSQSADPKFVHADINPLHVYVGQTQTLSVTLQSSAPVTSVTATTKLDNQTLTLNLTESGVDSNGNPIYSTSWTVFDTHVTTYNTTFTATNSAGQSNSITLAWSDPCTGVGRGVDSTLGANCTVSAVDGLDGGNLTIPGGTTLTLNSGAKWVWNPGKSITVNGAIAINGTATMEKGYLFYSGSTNDTAVSSTNVFDTNSTKASHVRVQTWFKFGQSIDVAVSSVVTSPTVTIGGISGSQTITLSGDGASKQMSINGGAWVTSGSITNGQTLRVRLTSSPNENTTTTVGATIGVGGGGGSISTFSVRTIFNDPCPLC